MPSTSSPLPEPTTSDCPDTIDADRLRHRVEQHLHEQGFVLESSGLVAPAMDDKDRLRKLHAEAVAESRQRAEKALRRYESQFLDQLALGREVDPNEIRPALVPISDRKSFEGLLWRWCSLHWSIPVSSGYGRRLRFLVVDLANEKKVVGLIGLGDPVFALGCRDAWIGWSVERRRTHLASIMDAFVLGAVPPYNSLCGGKLVALLATSTEVRAAFEAKYSHRETLIARRDPNAVLALITTTSALGRSSVYNRLVGPQGDLAFRPVGYTAGTGDFHFAGSIYRDLAKYAALANQAGGTYRHERWTGSGFRNRREVIQRALEELGFDSRQFRLHGVRRQVFVAPLMQDAKRYLSGEIEYLEWRTQSVAEIGKWWRTKWAIRRANGDTQWRSFHPESWRLWPSKPRQASETA
jgi:hypothetical protein